MGDVRTGQARPPETKHGAVPVESLGDYCIRLGYTTPERVKECLDRQRTLEREGRVVPRLGELMVERGYLSTEQVVEALSGQRQEIRYCPKCCIHVNVFIRSDAVAYRCARCKTELTRPSNVSSLAAEDDSPLLLTQEDLPPEVARAKSHPESVFGKYILVRELGRGGAGVIYLAWDSYLSEYVALKLLRPDHEDPQDHSTRTGQLVREARNTIRLRHPNIITVFDVGRVGRDFYISMEFLEGQTLEDRISASRSRGFRSPYFEDAPGTLRMLAETARAVHYAHTQPSPIIHCDLKPGNILVDAEGHPHVLDFGLARNMKLERPRNGEITGTPSYMSPEQACGIADQIDHRTDIYSLGAILYELLTGRPTFSGETISVLEKTVSENPEAPSEVLKLNPEALNRPRVTVPPFLEEVCMRCLDKNPELRPRTTLEVAELLEQAARSLCNKPVFVSPATVVPPPRSMRPSAAPQRPWIAILATLVVLLVVALGWISRPGTAPPVRADLPAEIRARLGAFEPSRALTLARLLEGPEKAPLTAQAAKVLALAEALARAVSDRQPELAEFRLRERTLRHVKLVKATDSGIQLIMSGRTLTQAWREVEPSQILDLARRLELERDPVLRHALGLYAQNAGRLLDARDYFDSLPPAFDKR